MDNFYGYRDPVQVHRSKRNKDQVGGAHNSDSWNVNNPSKRQTPIYTSQNRANLPPQPYTCQQQTLKQEISPITTFQQSPLDTSCFQLLNGFPNDFISDMDSERVLFQCGENQFHEISIKQENYCLDGDGFGEPGCSFDGLPISGLTLHRAASEKIQSEHKLKEFQFKNWFISIVNHVQDGTASSERRRNQDGDIYSDSQLEEIAQAIRTRLRRVDISKGGAEDKFKELCEKIVDVVNTKDMFEKEEKIDLLRKQPCIRIDAKTKDGRVQIPRWTRDKISDQWKEKKVYLKREIYVLFHPEDIHTNHLKHNQIYNKYCSSPSEGNGPHNLCVNALHYDKVIDESSFCERLRHWALKDSRPVATEDGFLTNRIDNDAWDKKFQKWVKDLTKFLRNDRYSSPDEFLRLVENYSDNLVNFKFQNLCLGKTEPGGKENSSESLRRRSPSDPCCLLKHKTTRDYDTKIKEILRGILRYVRHEPNIAPDLDPRDLWQCAARNRGVYCINPHHCNYEPNRKTNPMTDRLISPPTHPSNQNALKQCLELPSFSHEQWCHLSFIRFYKVQNQNGQSQRSRRLHDEMKGFCEIDKGINDFLVSSIKVRPYNIDFWPNGKNKLEGKWSLINKEFEDLVACTELVRSGDDNHKQCIARSRLQSLNNIICCHSYRANYSRKNFFETFANLSKSRQFDVEMRMSAQQLERYHNASLRSENAPRELEYSIYVRNTGSKEIYVSLPKQWTDDQLPQPPSNSFSCESCRVFQRLHPKEVSKELVYSQEEKKELENLVRKFYDGQKSLSVHEKEEASSVLILLDWNKMGDRNILQEKMQPLDPTNPSCEGLFSFTGSFHQLEYFLLQNTKTRQFIENLNQTNSKVTTSN
ncbi:Oidioi.mRNA.OKI2018_I69.XSR.g16884.t3.cds [Oikopleura dioica]|uniref:Oidioi.mRNA.OKI2018_I69.XSR.g16884.t3.cds n=1 Tax=Oikopleura dioica TaxID=34765 RepID=A0ABN7SNU2_OIKDI|nr:Oidioi.mRNA.OKI2018_I69.XSR.g16884.t3.cds [Oikopleura dioica]